MTTEPPAMFAKIQKAYIPAEELRAALLALEEQQLLPRRYEYGEDWLLESLPARCEVLEWLRGEVECRGADALKVAWLVGDLLEGKDR